MSSSRLTSEEVPALRCPYCRNPLKGHDRIVLCEVCRTAHHAGCWNTHGFRCAVFSCSGIRLAVPSQPVPWKWYATAIGIALFLFLRLSPWLVFSLSR